MVPSSNARSNPTHAWRWGLLPALVLLAGCQSLPERNRETHPDTLLLINTWEALVKGDYNGHRSMAELTAAGDHGLGTFTGLDGEMILVSGVVYRAAADGSLSVMPPEARSPYALVTWFEEERWYDLADMPREMMERAIDLRLATDAYPVAIRGEVLFDWIVTRSVPAASAPWPGLYTALERQQVQTNTLLEATLAGYYIPASLAAFHPPGYHLHMVSADRTIGGHVLDFQLRKGRIALDPTPDVYLMLPTNQPAFRFNPPAPGKPEQPGTRPLGPVLPRE